MPEQLAALSVGAGHPSGRAGWSLPVASRHGKGPGQVGSLAFTKLEEVSDSGCSGGAGRTLVRS